jgi:hypothetical protein
MTSTSRRTRRVALTTSALVTAALSVVSASAPAQADTRNVAFAVSGTFTVPVGITSVHVVATGGAGGRTLDNVAGGRGAQVTADIAVSPGQVLHVHVGGAGAAAASGGAGGANGGGSASDRVGGGGGGASDVRLGGDALADRVVVAAGGGGATYYGLGSFGGGDAGAAGGMLNTCPESVPAQPGTATAGGNGSRGGGASCSYWTAGGDGTFGQGGPGVYSSLSNSGGGGGGGGWYGGGGGGQYAAGAGGSSYVDAGTGSRTSSYLIDSWMPPSVVISYDRVSQSVAFAAGTPGSVTAGTSYDLTTVPGASGNPAVLAVASGSTAGACSLDGSTVSFLHVGTCKISASQDGDDSYLPATAAHAFTIGEAPTTVDLDVTGSRLTAEVGVDAPSTLPATGSVRFLLGGDAVATVELVQGRAVLTQSVPVTGAASIRAEFLGIPDLAPSSADAERAVQQIGFASSSPATATVGTSATIAATWNQAGPTGSMSAGTGDSAVCTLSGTTVTFQHAGTCEVRAQQPGDWAFTPAAATHTIAVGGAGTTTTVGVLAGSLTARVVAVSPSSVTPIGQVRFLVDGTAVGTAELVDGRAALDHVVARGGTRTVTAEYLGNGDTLASSASTTRADPTISATVSSGSTPRGGWYRSPVTVSFTCTENGAALVSCPSARLLTSSGARQTVSATVTAVDGGSATVTVPGISIDMVAPVIKVTGVKNGRTVKSRKRPVLRCVGADALSGPASCKVTQRVLKKKGSKTTIRYVATATDHAGNVATSSGRYVWVKRK